MIKTLFVDDSSIACKLAKKNLEELCNIDYASDIPEALSKIVTDHFSVFILDYKLLSGTGLELARTIRSMDEYKDVPILLLSSVMSNQIAYAAMRARINKSFNKLISYETVKAEILKQIKNPTIEKVKLEAIETRCIAWRNDLNFYQYSPEFNLTVLAASAEEANRKMEEAIVQAFRSKQILELCESEINVILHCPMIPKGLTEDIK